MSTQTDSLPCRSGSKADADAAATSSVISTLRQQLRHQEVLEHPTVSSELRKLEEELTAQLITAGRAPGRHRMPAARRKPGNVIDGTPWVVSVE